MIDYLKNDFEQMWTRLTVDANDPMLKPPLLSDHLFKELVTAYSEPHRKYHTLQHVYECVKLFHEYENVAKNPDAVLFALWYHDIQYDVTKSDNEVVSACWAQNTVALSGIKYLPVYRLIYVTSHGIPRTLKQDEKLVVDIDLAILGADPVRFAEYEAQIREEYQHISDDRFWSARKYILEMFLKRKWIYHTKEFRNRFENQARINLTQSISQI